LGDLINDGPLIARFDGTKTPIQIYNDAYPVRIYPRIFGLRDFTELVARMIERGYLILATCEKGLSRELHSPDGCEVISLASGDQQAKTSKVLS